MSALPEGPQSGAGAADAATSVWTPLVHHLPAAVSEPFQPAAVVLREQVAALKELTPEQPPTAIGLPISTRDRSRLIDLAMRVLSQAALETEAQCRRIVASAESRAAEIVDEARVEVERITSWLEEDQAPVASEGVPTIEGREYAWPERNAADATGAADAANAVEPASPRISPMAARAPGEMLDPDSDVANDFFGSTPTSDDDAWSFLDEDLVGVGPTLMKLVRRRPPTREPPDN